MLDESDAAAAGTSTGGRTATVAYFVSDHGFGHAARSLALLSELIHRGAEVVIVSKVPRWFFEDSLQGLPFGLISIQVDVGMHQKTSVEFDLETTLVRLKEHWDGIDDKIDILVAELSKRFDRPGIGEKHIKRIVFDIPALAPLVAEKLGVPSMAISNFTWDWIYEPFGESYPEYQTYVDLHRNSYAKTTILLNLVYSEIKNMNCPTYEIPWLVRSATLGRSTVRSRLGLDDAQRYCLYSFGGHIFPLVKIHQWQIPEHWTIILVDKALTNSQTEKPYMAHRPNVFVTSQTNLNNLKIQYVDLIAAMDLVVCKTGYGIVSECIRHGISVLYTDRPGFIEHESMARAFRENVSSEEVSIDEVLDASPSLWAKAERVVPNSLRSLYSFDGAQKAASVILSSDWPSNKEVSS